MVRKREKEDPTWEEKETDRAAHGMTERCIGTDRSPYMRDGGHSKCDM